MMLITVSIEIPTKTGIKPPSSSRRHFTITTEAILKVALFLSTFAVCWGLFSAPKQPDFDRLKEVQGVTITI